MGANTKDLTHKQLVKRAGKWLRDSARCRVVMEEFTACAESREIPDAIGWNACRCIMIECKRTRSDFLTDKKKPARNDGTPALGEFRFYFAPPGLIRPDELPDGWGLYEVHKEQIRHAGGVSWANAKPAPLTSDKGSEVALLLSAIRRLEISTAVFVQPNEYPSVGVEHD